MSGPTLEFRIPELKWNNSQEVVGGGVDGVVGEEVWGRKSIFVKGTSISG